MISHLFKQKKGNISLTLVIILAAILISMGISLTLTSVDHAYMSRSFYLQTINKTISRSCVEDGINRIKKDPNYTGSFTITLSDGNCIAEITNTPTPGVKKISVTSNYNEFVHNEEKYLDTNTVPFQVLNNI